MVDRAELPAGWQILRLGDVANLETGGTPSRSQPAYWGGQVPWMASGEINQRRVTATAERITLEGLNHSNAKMFPPGTIMVAMNGQGATRGKTSMLDIEAACNQSLAAVRSNEHSNNDFLFHVLDSAYQRLRRMTGDGRSGLNLGLLRMFRLLLPPLAEQRAIAAVLNSIDETIERTEAVIVATERLRDALLHELLTCGLPGKHTEFKQVSGIGTIPAVWKVVRLGDVANVTFSSVDKKMLNDEISVQLCNYTDVFYNRRIRTEMEFMTATATRTERERWSLKRGDVLFTKDSESPDEIGMPSVVTEDMPNVLCGYHLGLARPRVNSIEGEFLTEVLRSRASRREFARVANGVTRFGLTLSATHSLPVLLPPLVEQRAIATMLENADGVIEQTRAELNPLLALKAAASEALLTGLVRVSPVGIE